MLYTDLCSCLKCSQLPMSIFAFFLGLHLLSFAVQIFQRYDDTRNTHSPFRILHNFCSNKLTSYRTNKKKLSMNRYLIFFFYFVFFLSRIFTPFSSLTIETNILVAKMLVLDNIEATNCKLHSMALIQQHWHNITDNSSFDTVFFVCSMHGSSKQNRGSLNELRSNTMMQKQNPYN